MEEKLEEVEKKETLLHCQVLPVVIAFNNNASWIYGIEKNNLKKNILNCYGKKCNIL